MGQTGRNHRWTRVNTDGLASVSVARIEAKGANAPSSPVVAPRFIDSIEIFLNQQLKTMERRPPTRLSTRASTIRVSCVCRGSCFAPASTGAASAARASPRRSRPRSAASAAGRARCAPARQYVPPPRVPGATARRAPGEPSAEPSPPASDYTAAAAYARYRHR